MSKVSSKWEQRLWKKIYGYRIYRKNIVPYVHCVVNEQWMYVRYQRQRKMGLCPPAAANTLTLSMKFELQILIDLSYGETQPNSLPLPLPHDDS
jgi:hypothetical protein